MMRIGRKKCFQLLRSKKHINAEVGKKDVDWELVLVCAH